MTQKKLHELVEIVRSVILSCVLLTLTLFAKTASELIPKYLSKLELASIYPFLLSLYLCNISYVLNDFKVTPMSLLAACVQ